MYVCMYVCMHERMYVYTGTRMPVCEFILHACQEISVIFCTVLRDKYESKSYFRKLSKLAEIPQNRNLKKHIFCRHNDSKRFGVIYPSAAVSH